MNKHILQIWSKNIFKYLRFLLNASTKKMINNCNGYTIKNTSTSYKYTFSNNINKKSSIKNPQDNP